MKKPSKCYTVCLKMYMGFGKKGKRIKSLNLNRNRVVGYGGTHLNPNTWEAQAGRSLCIQGQTGLQSECQDNQRYTEITCLKKPKIINKNKRNRV